MIVVCAWCARQSLPSFLKETEPFSDTQVSHSICQLHAEELRARLRRAAERERQAQGEAGA